MPLVPLKFKAGIVKDLTEYSAGKVGPFYVDSNLVRFRNGYASKIGGWLQEKYFAIDTASNVTSDETLIQGIARNVVSWRSFSDGDDRIVIGTHNHLYIIKGQALFDITPVRDYNNRATTLTEALDTSETSIDVASVVGLPTAGAIKIGSEIITYTGISTLTLTGCTRGTNSTSAATADSGATVTAILINPILTNSTTTVTITDNSHGALDGDFVVFENVATVGGVDANILNRKTGFQISNVTTNTFAITVPTAATGNATGGGLTIIIQYLIGSDEGLGSQTAVSSLGFGSGAWGESTWGTARAVTSTTVFLENSQFSLNLWGEDVIATVRGGGIYYWDLSNGESNRAVEVSTIAGSDGVPTKARVSTISFPDRHAIALGSTPYPSGDLDPMLVRWSTQEDFTIWKPEVTNSAGDQRLEIGTKIIASISTRNETFIATDEAVYGMTFVGQPFVFSFNLLAVNCGAAGKNVLANVDSTIYWMGKNNFFVYDGIVKDLPCSVQYFVFDRIKPNFLEKTTVGHNKKFNEVTWFYVSTDNTETTNPEPDSYVTFNYIDGAWTIGTLNRTVWSDAFGQRSNPFAFDDSGVLYNHEQGTTDNGAPMSAFIETGEIEIDQGGNNLYLVDKIIPDATMTANTNLFIQLKTKKYPNAPEITKGAFTITSSTTKVSTRAKGRQMAVRFSSTGTEDEWLLGDFRVNAKQDGMR